MVKINRVLVGEALIVEDRPNVKNCPDLRNTRVVDIVKELGEYNIEVDVYDPWVEVKEAQQEYNITPISHLEKGKYDTVIISVGHQKFRDIGITKIREFCKDTHIVYDLKYLFTTELTDLRL